MIISIDGKWKAFEFADVLWSLDLLYRAANPASDAEDMDLFRWSLGPHHYRWPRDDRTRVLKRRALKVSAIDFASPGFIEILGSGPVIGGLFAFLGVLINLHVTAPSRDADTRLKNAQARQIEDDLFNKRWGGVLGHRLEDTKAPLVNAIQDGRITAVQTSGPLKP